MAANSQFAVAIHVLTILAKGGDERVKSDYIAGSVNTNPVVIRRLLSNLQEANIVVSQVGAAGGTSLAKPAIECASRVPAERSVLVRERQSIGQQGIGRGYTAGKKPGRCSMN